MELCYSYVTNASKSLKLENFGCIIPLQAEAGEVFFPIQLRVRLATVSESRDTEKTLTCKHINRRISTEFMKGE